MKDGRVTIYDESHMAHSVPYEESQFHSLDSDYPGDSDNPVYECPCKPFEKTVLPEGHTLVIHNFGLTHGDDRLQ